MPRESDRNANKFHKGHYEIIAGRFREQVSRYQNEDGEVAPGTDNYYRLLGLKDLALSLSERFKFDNEIHDTAIFMERCGFVND